MREHEPLVEAVTPLAELAEKVPKLEGVPSGVPGLDDLFFVTEWRDGKPVRRSLGGVPRYAVLQVTGVSDTGKSLLVEQFAVERAPHGEPCVFVTTEAPGPFVAQSLQLRARAMGVTLETVERSVVLIDAATHTTLAHDLGTLLSTLAYAIRTYRAKAVVIDSLTGFYEAREMQAREIVRPLYLFLKKWHQTALAVSQKRSGHELLDRRSSWGLRRRAHPRRLAGPGQTAGPFGPTRAPLPDADRRDGTPVPHRWLPHEWARYRDAPHGDHAGRAGADRSTPE